tara:strand:+ start:1271 stop:1588 length:318 start_codon:yes stop_codon:yes gene_type:complete
MNSLRKRLEQLITIERSVENDDVILRQTLKYTPKKCEDCKNICRFRRKIAIMKRMPNCNWSGVDVTFYSKMCNVCKLYENPKNGKYNLSYMKLLAHYRNEKKDKQ